MEGDKLKNFLLGLKRKPVQTFTMEEIMAMEDKTNDEYENSDAEMHVESSDFAKPTKLAQSLFIHIGNGEYILDYDKIAKNTNLILPKSFYENKDVDVYKGWNYRDFKNHFKNESSYYEQ